MKSRTGLDRSTSRRSELSTRLSATASKETRKLSSSTMSKMPCLSSLKSLQLATVTSRDSLLRLKLKSLEMGTRGRRSSVLKDNSSSLSLRPTVLMTKVMLSCRLRTSISSIQRGLNLVKLTIFEGKEQRRLKSISTARSLRLVSTLTATMSPGCLLERT